MIVPTWLQFLRTLAFEDRPQTRTRPTQPISLVDWQMCGSRGALVEGGPEAWDFCHQRL